MNANDIHVTNGHVPVTEGALPRESNPDFRAREGTTAAELDFTGERCIPGTSHPALVAQHVRRYAFAIESFATASSACLDVGCGAGYGAALLAGSCAQVTAIDVSEEAIAYARRHYCRGNIDWMVQDACQLALDDSSFDLVVAFEVIEHVPDAERFVSEVDRVLKDGGCLVLSTPVADSTHSHPENPFHVREFLPADLKTLLSSRFALVEMFGQRREGLAGVIAPASGIRQRLRRFFPRRTRAWMLRLAGEKPFAELQASDFVISRSLAGAEVIVAIARKGA